jgi:hypothetical protein
MARENLQSMCAPLAISLPSLLELSKCTGPQGRYQNQGIQIVASTIIDRVSRATDRKFHCTIESPKAGWECGGEWGWRMRKDEAGF